MKKSSARILEVIKKHPEVIFEGKNVTPQKETLENITQFARSYSVQSTTPPINKGVVMN